MRTKKVLSVLFLVLSLTIICSCGRKQDKTAIREIEFMNWESSSEGMKFMNFLIKEFEKENPGIKIKNNVVTGDSFSKLLTRFAGGAPPDIFEIQAEILQPFLEKKILLDLSPYIKKSSKLKEGDFFPLSLVNFRYDGKSFRQGDLYGFPKDFGSAVLIYNKNLFDQAGLSYPDATWTEKEYLDAAKKLTKRDAAGRPIQTGIDRTINPLYLMLDYGGQIWSADQKRCLLDSQPAAKAYQFIYDLQKVYKVALSQEEVKEGVGEGIGFKSGKAGMSMVWRYELPDLSKYISNNFQWGVAPLPSFNGKNIQLLHGPSGWAVAGSTKYPEECFKFMEFLVGERGQIETAKLGWNIPGNKKIAYSDYFLKNMNRTDSEEINRIFLKEADGLNLTRLNPYIPISRFDIIINEALSSDIVRKYNGKVNIPLKMAVEKINKEIAESFTRNETR